MEQLIFFEKPGCATNSRQKLLLKNAGVEFEARSLLSEQWTTDRLESFFSGLPIDQWFNRAAPRVKSGEVIPERISAAQALVLMVADPLLIRRPLLELGSWRSVGFDWGVLANRLGIESQSKAKLEKSVNGPLEGCSHKGNDSRQSDVPAENHCANHDNEAVEYTA